MIDTSVDRNAQRNATGKRIDVSKGGLRVRSRATLPDGSDVTVCYDFDATTSERGSVRIERADHTGFTVSDMGMLMIQDDFDFIVETAMAHISESEEADEPNRFNHDSLERAEAADPTSRVRPQLVDFWTAVVEGAAVATAAVRPNTAKSGRSSSHSRSRSPKARNKNNPSRAGSASKRGGVKMSAAETVAHATQYIAREGVATGNGLGVVERVREALYTFSIAGGYVNVRDAEHNEYRLTMEGSPSCNLAGELLAMGDLPAVPAVINFPMPPRLFVLHVRRLFRLKSVSPLLERSSFPVLFYFLLLIHSHPRLFSSRSSLYLFPFPLLSCILSCPLTHSSLPSPQRPKLDGADAADSSSVPSTGWSGTELLREDDVRALVSQVSANPDFRMVSAQSLVGLTRETAVETRGGGRGHKQREEKMSEEALQAHHTFVWDLKRLATCSVRACSP
jgi:hypothetical protein